jgi:hypothetical protein
MGEREGKFCLFVPVGLQELFYMPYNFTTWDLPALLPIREGRCAADFYRP